MVKGPQVPSSYTCSLYTVRYWNLALCTVIRGCLVGRHYIANGSQR